MNKFFPLPMLVYRNLSFFLLVTLLGAFLTLAYFTSAYAQQHDSPASARKLDTDYPISLTLPAYATEYFYFTLPNVEDNIPTITLSNSSEIHVQLYDSRESSLKYMISSSNVITVQDSLFRGERYFLKLSSRSSQDKKLKLTLHYMQKEKEDSDTKKSTKAANKSKNSAKSQTVNKSKNSKKSKTATGPKNPAKSKTANKSKNSKKSKTATGSKNPVKSQTATGSKNPRILITTPKPITSAKPKNTGATARHSAKTIATPTARPKKSAKQTTTNPNSKSNFLLSTHFLRTKAGTSFAIAEALNLSEESSSLSYQCIFSDRISIQNGILYSRSPGIAVIEIVGNDFKSSCTICIQ